MISIAMTTYNGEKYIREQIESILNQTVQDFELIIVDDNSSDATVSIINQYKEAVCKLKLYVNDINIGFIKNFEKALSLCTGEYIAFADQDDIWFSDHLKVLFDNIEDNYLICADAELYNRYPMGIRMRETLTLDFIPTNSVFFYLLYNNFVQGSTMMINRKLIDKISAFPNNPGYFHDHWLALYAAYYDKICYVDQAIMFYRQHDEAITVNKRISLLNLLRKRDYGNIQKNRIECLLNFNRMNTNSKNDYLDDAIKFYSGSKIFRAKYYAKNYKKMYSVNTYKYFFLRIVRMILGVSR